MFVWLASYKGLKFIPTPPKPNSHRSLIKDFNSFTRNMRLKFLFADHNSKPHPFHVKSKWRPPPQPSMALENYLKRTKYEIATISFCDTQDNLSAKEQEALKKLRANTKVNIKKADKGNTTVVMDTQGKITEGSDQVYDTNYYTPLQEPIVASTANKVKLIVNKLYVKKRLSSGSTIVKIHPGIGMARLVTIQIRFISEGKLSRIQRRKYRMLQARLFTHWDEFSNNKISALRLLRPCPHASGNFFFCKYFFRDAKIFASTHSVFKWFGMRLYPELNMRIIAILASFLLHHSYCKVAAYHSKKSRKSILMHVNGPMMKLNYC